MRFFYTLFVYAYRLAIGLAAIFSKKAGQWINGRKNIFSRLEHEIKFDKPLIWFHCASLGEFEQGRSLIERLKTQKPEYQILLTFFSPSGYEIRKNYDKADYVFYLPYDSPSNAKKFLEIVRPEMVFFVKYEFWFNYIKQINKHSIPLYLISAAFRPEQHFFKWWGIWQRMQLKKFNFFFVQDDNSLKLLKSVGIENALLTGDTRLDRVKDILLQEVNLPILDKFCKNNFVLCAGSSWPPDEDIISSYLKAAPDDMKLIMAPHDISEKHINEILEKFANFKPILYTSVNKDIEFTSDNKVLIINTIGMLNKLYRFADVAYIGGGFGVSIHNLPEAAVYGIPVIYGPRHEKFKEAIELAECGGGFPINNVGEFINLMNSFYSDRDFLNNASVSASKYIDDNTGATQMIYQKVFKS